MQMDFELALFLFFLLVTFIIVFLIFFIRFLMKRNRFPFLLLVPCIIIFQIFLNDYIQTNYHFTFDDISIEYTDKTLTSPDGLRNAQLQYEYYGGAAGGVNLLVKLLEENKVIYYADAQNTIRVNWLDNETLTITNNSFDYPADSRDFTLKVDTEIYHDKGLACKSIPLKGTYETCYSKNRGRS